MEAHISTWRDKIVAEFTPELSKVTLAFDPDDLLKEELILALIRAKGFDVLEYEDPIAFRYVYESSYRSRWDRNEQTDLIVILRTESGAENDIPYDLFQLGRKVHLSLNDVFENLSSPIIKQIDRELFDQLDNAYRLYCSRRLSDNETIDFVLSYLFEITPHLVKNSTDLLKLLFGLHSRSTQLPEICQQRLVALVTRNNNYKDWPIESLICDRSYFYLFIEERWQLFIRSRSKANASQVHDPIEQPFLKHPGPTQLPFEHDDIKGQLISLFADGKIRPANTDIEINARDEWIRLGIRQSFHANRSLALESAISRLDQSISSESLSHLDWGAIALQYSYSMKLALGTQTKPDSELTVRVQQIFRTVESKFSTWLNSRYSSLHNLPSVPPVMLHHVPRYMAYELGKNDQHRIALLVLDGLSLVQWLVIKEALEKNSPDYRFEDSTVFAWIPTITSVSRQSIFGGVMPLFYPDTILGTDSEAKKWSRFWADRGLMADQVVYIKHTSPTELLSFNHLVDSPPQVLGIVIDAIDRIMHGNQLGAEGMLSQLQHWIDKGLLHQVLCDLKTMDYQVLITSDHGNVESVGIGAFNEGVMAQTRGSRVRIYDTKETRDNFASKIQGSRPWDPIGLPDSFWPILAESNNAFIKKDEITVTHGGGHIQEVLVPFVTVNWNK